MKHTTPGDDLLERLTKAMGQKGAARKEAEEYPAPVEVAGGNEYKGAKGAGASTEDRREARREDVEGTGDTLLERLTKAMRGEGDEEVVGKEPEAVQGEVAFRDLLASAMGQGVPTSREPTPEELPSTFRTIMFGVAREDGLIADVWTAATPYLGDSFLARPLGRFNRREDGSFGYDSMEDVYGKDYLSLSYDDRAKRIRNVDNAQLKEEYADIYQAGLEGSWGAMLGSFGGALSDPTSIIPFTFAGKMSLQLYKAAVAGGTLGGVDSMADQLAKEGTIDWGTAITYTALGAALAPAALVVTKIPSLLRGTTPAMSRKPIDSMTGKEANKLMDTVEQDVVDVFTTTPDDILLKYREARATEYGVSVEEVSERLSLVEMYQERFREVFPNIHADVAALEKRAGREFRKITPQEAVDMTRRDVTGETSGFVDVMRKTFASGDRRMIDLNERIGKMLVHKDMTIMAQVSKYEQNLIDTKGTVKKLAAHATRFIDEEYKMGKRGLPTPKGGIRAHLSANPENKVQGEAAVWDLIQDQRWQVVEYVARKSRVDITEIQKLRKGLNEIGKAGEKYGAIRKGQMITGYFPRRLRDMEGLMSEIDKGLKTKLLKAIEAAERAHPRGTLTTYQRDLVVARYIAREGVETVRNKMQGRRRYKQIPTPLKKFYYSPKVSYTMYIRDAVEEIEYRKFLGKGTRSDGEDGVIGISDNIDILKDIHVDAGSTIGKLLRTEKAAGRLTYHSQKEIVETLRMQYQEGRRSPHRTISTMKDLTYLVTIANFKSAVKQFGDIAISMAINGAVHTVSATANIGKRALRGSDGKKVVSHVSRVANEMVDNPNWAGAALGKMLYLSGFSKVDKIGKNITHRGAIRKAMRQGRTSKGRTELYNRWYTFMGDTNYKKMLQEIEHANKTNEVGEILDYLGATELYNLQPIGKTSTPYAYQAAPNWTIAYALHTWSLRLINTIITRGVYRIQNGDKVGGAVQLAALGLWMGGMGMGVDTVRDVMSGKVIGGLEEFTERFQENLYSIIMLNRYTRINLIHSAFTETFSQVANPAILGLGDSAVRILYSLSQGDTDKAQERAWAFSRYIPLIGSAGQAFAPGKEGNAFERLGGLGGGLTGLEGL